MSSPKCYCPKSDDDSTSTDYITGRNVWFGFVTTATTHGVLQIYKSKGGCKKLVWMIALLGCTGALVYQMYLVTSFFLQYNVSPIYVKQTARTQEFPAVSICNTNPIKASALHSSPQLQALIDSWKKGSRKRRDVDNTHFILSSQNNINEEYLESNSKRIKRQAVTCPALFPPGNGYYTGNDCSSGSSVPGTICRPMCNDNSDTLYGNSVIMCQKNGTWNMTERPCCVGSCNDSVSILPCGMPMKALYRNRVLSSYNLHIWVDLTTRKAGKITQWKFYSEQPETLYPSVWRPGLNDTFQLIGYTKVTSVGSSAEQTMNIPVGEQLEINPGDCLGIFDSKYTTLTFPTERPQQPRTTGLLDIDFYTVNAYTISMEDIVGQSSFSITQSTPLGFSMAKIVSLGATVESACEVLPTTETIHTTVAIPTTEAATTTIEAITTTEATTTTTTEAPKTAAAITTTITKATPEATTTTEEATTTTEAATTKAATTTAEATTTTEPATTEAITTTVEAATTTKPATTEAITTTAEATTTTEPATTEATTTIAATTTEATTKATTKAASLFPEREPPREDFLQESEVLEALADLPDAVKKTLGYESMDLILSCQYEGKDCNISDFGYFFDAVNGNCYSFNSGFNDNPLELISKQAGTNSGLNMVLNLGQHEYVAGISKSAGIVVVVHPKSRMPFPEDEGVFAAPGQITSIGINKVSVSRLPQPYGNCSEETTNPSINVFEERYKVKYSPAACYKTCHQKYVIERCGCSDPQYPSKGKAFGDHNVTSCSVRNTFQDDCMYGVLQDYISNKLECTCPTPCRESAYRYTLSRGIWPADIYKNDFVNKYNASLQNVNKYSSRDVFLSRNIVKVEVYFNEFDYRVLYENPKYPIHLYLADVCSIIGLWLGMSLFSLTEFLEFAVDFGIVLCCKIKKQTRLKHEKEKELQNYSEASMVQSSPRKTSEVRRIGTRTLENWAIPRKRKLSPISSDAVNAAVNTIFKNRRYGTVIQPRISDLSYLNFPEDSDLNYNNKQHTDDSNHDNKKISVVSTSNISLRTDSQIVSTNDDYWDPLFLKHI